MNLQHSYGLVLTFKTSFVKADLFFCSGLAPIVIRLEEIQQDGYFACGLSHMTLMMPFNKTLT